MTDEPLNSILSFPSDKNGCGMYRTIVPFQYMSTVKNWNSSFVYQFIFDLNLIRGTNYIRFQRQCTENQKRCVLEYRRCIDASRAGCKIVYELDDIVHGIEPHNILAYQFYTKTRRDNVLDMMRMSHMVTFSTKFLKHFYEREHGIKNSVVLPNFLPKFLWKPDPTISKRPNKSKPVVMWAGSASHVGPGGDLEFLIPMIEATVDEFEWLFVGCLPPVLNKYRDQGKISFVDWAPFFSYPSMMQSLKADVALSPIKDSLFNYAKSDLKYVEYSAMNIPTIASTIGNKIGPYDLTNCPNLVKNDPDAWYEKIKELTASKEKQDFAIQKGHEYIKNRWFENEENVSLYLKTYAC